MDGAGTLTVFTRIILPMCTPILATVGIFSAVNQWNSFQDTLIYMTDSKLYSLQYLLYTYINQASALANAAKANSANVAALASAATPDLDPYDGFRHRGAADHVHLPVLPALLRQGHDAGRG